MEQRHWETKRSKAAVKLSEDEKLQLFELLEELGEKMDGRWRVRVLEEGKSVGQPFAVIQFALRAAWSSVRIDQERHEESELVLPGLSGRPVRPG